MSRSRRIAASVVVLLSVLVSCLAQMGGSNVTMTSVASFGKNPTSCKMSYWKPAGVAAGTKLPCIVAPHYCGAKASSAESWYKLTPKATSGTVKFMVIYPENTHSGGCWEPWNADAMKHDVGGDTLAVAEMVRYGIKSLDVDPNRVYITGFSSGASMASAMAAVYPELFEGVSSFSGVPPGCIDPAVSGGGGFGGMGGGKAPAPSTCFGGNFTKTIEEWGKLVHEMQGSTPYTGKYPRAQIYHGNNDELLDYRYFFEEIKIWQAVHNLTGTIPTTPATTRLGGQGVTTTIEANFMQGTHALTYQTDAVLAFFGLTNANYQPPPKNPDQPSTPANLCATTNGGCSANAACTPTDSSRTCKCNTGFTGDGVTCTAGSAANACKTANGGCDANAACTLSGTAPVCKCNTGYTGDGTTCTKGGDTPAAGNACKTNNGGCDKTNAACSLSGTTTVTIVCKCNTGFSSTDNGRTCVANDVPTTDNACAVDNGGCDAEYATCRISAGAVKCTCMTGYVLNTDQKTCKLNSTTPPTTGNKCKTNNGGCDATAGICTLGTGGTTVTCSCEEGYTLGTNKKTCTLIEEEPSGEQTKDAGTSSSGSNSTTYIIIAVVAGVVLLAIGVYFFFIRPKAAFNQNANKMTDYSGTNMTSYYNTSPQQQQQPYQPAPYQPQPPPARY